MPSRPWYKWFPGDYLADTYSLSWDADLLYRRILDALWQHETLPRDLRDLSQILRTDPRKISRILPELLPYLSETSGRLSHPRMTAQRAELSETTAKRRKAAQARWDASASTTDDASASNARSARARPDPDPDKDLSAVPAFEPEDPPARVREASPEAKALQAQLERRREALGIEARPRLVATFGKPKAKAGD